ncbi:MAG: hypothetical protein ACE5E8_00220 [Acidimicrobiia bacterium]
MRHVTATVVLALLTSACGGGAAASTAPPASGVTSTTPTEPAQKPTVQPTPAASPLPEDTTSTSTSTSTTTTTAADFDGPQAPDFTMVVENRTAEFHLSAEKRPVYIVFWAEW